MIWIYLLIAAFGFIPFMIVLYKMNKLKRMKSNGIKTTALIKEVFGVSHHHLNSVVIEYLVEDTRQVITKKILVAGLPYQVGDHIPIYYNKQRPTKMLVDAGKNFTFSIVFTLLLAIILIAACFLIQNSINKGEL